MFFALIPLAILLAVFLYSDLGAQRGRMEEVPGCCLRCEDLRGSGRPDYGERKNSANLTQIFRQISENQFPDETKI